MTLAWHVHHEILLEPLTEPIETRRAYIQSSKPPEEIETRLRLLKEVKGELPLALIAAAQTRAQTWQAYIQAKRTYYQTWRGAYDQAAGACVQTWQASNQAGETYVQAVEAYTTEINALHTLECPDCPWDGTTIFSAKE